MKSLIQSLSVSKRDLLDKCRCNIARYNASVNALIKEVDISKQTNRVYQGIPIVIKNNINIKDHATTCASLLLKDYIPSFNATIVTKLLEHSFHIVGIANLDEFAVGSESNTGIFGATKNIFDDTISPGGSSGGSAVAVTCGMAPVALGTDTGGSVRTPCSLNGLYGFKPTYGTISRYGVIAFGSSLEQVGIMAQNCEDLMFVYQTIKGKDQHDQTTVDIPANKPEDYSLKNKRCGYDPAIISSLSPQETEAIQKFISFLEQEGVIMVDLPFHSKREIDTCYKVVSSSEAVSNFARYGGCIEGTRTDYKLRGKWSINIKQRMFIGGYSLLHNHLYETGLRLREKIVQESKAMFTRVDFYLNPTVVFKNNNSEMDEYAMIANLAGGPALTIPVGTIGRIPFGCHLHGPYMEDHLILKVGQRYNEMYDNNVCYEKL